MKFTPEEIARQLELASKAKPLPWVMVGRHIAVPLNEFAAHPIATINDHADLEFIFTAAVTHEAALATIAQQQAEIGRLTRELTALQERTRWRKYPDEKPDSDEEIPEVYCFRKWTGNEYEIYSRSYWCEFTLLDVDEIFYDVCEYNFQYGAWEKHYEGKDLQPIVTRYTTLPEPPEAESG